MAVFRIRIRTEPHYLRPPGSGSAWTDADPHGQMRIQEVKNAKIELKIAATY